MSDPEALELADFLLIAEAVLGVPAEAMAQSRRIVALAESALAAPLAGFGDEEFYPEFAQKAAILCSRLLRNHPLPDGNKRVAYLCLVEFAERNGCVWLPPAGDVDGGQETVDTIFALAAGELSEEDFVLWVRERLKQA